MTSKQGVLSLGCFHEGIHPLVAYDDELEVCEVRTGRSVGWLKVTLALGVAPQINTLISKEAEEDRRREQ